MASGVIFHPCFLLSYYLIGLLVTAHNVPQAQLTPHKGQHLMKVSIGTPPVDIYGTADTGSNLAGHHVYLVMTTASNRFIPYLILKSPPHIVKFLVIQKNVIKYGTMAIIVLLKIVAIMPVDIQVVYPKVF